jgi:carbon storage regulator
MLVLSRKRGEKIVVPQCALSVTVIGVQGNAVRLGITAPPEVAVHREELWREIHGEDSGVASVEPVKDSLDAFTAELSDAAYQIALRHGLADSWVDLELGLWAAVAVRLKNFRRKSSRPVQKSEQEAFEDQAVRLPR